MEQATQIDPETGEELAPTRTLSGEGLKDLGGQEASEPKEGAEAVREMAGNKRSAKNVRAETQSAALDWFIGDDPVGGTDQDFTVVSVNVGGDTAETRRMIDWVIAPISLDTLRTIRRRANSSREARRTGMTDEFQTNLEIVAVCTVDPNLTEAAKALADQGKIQQADRVEALRYRFGSRPGFITQLAGKILTAAGFDEDDVQDKDQVEAAGNS